MEYAALEDLLRRVVEAAGGRAGVLTTWDPEHRAHTSTYNLDADAAERLREVVERSAAPLHDRGGAAVTQLEDDARDVSVQAGLGPLEAVALPVYLQDKSIGLLCLLHPQGAPAALKASPGTYNLRIDHAEVVVQNALLLQRLLAERRWLEAVVHHSASGILILDQEGLVQGFNLALERLSGWTLDEAVGRPAHDVFPMRVGDRVALPRDLVPAYGEDDDAVSEGLLQVRDGSWVDVEIAATAVRGEDPGVLGYVVTLRDIRVRKERERLERIFLSGVSHELQTPIAVIQGFSGILADPDIRLDEAQVREKAAIIQEESRRLERMVEQMLYATRIQGGGIRLKPEPVAVHRLAERVAQKMEILADAASTRLVLSVEQVEPVQADPDLLENVLTNLIENAIKYARGKDVEITVRARPRAIEVAVADHGPGIPEEVRGRIFEPFERGEQGPGTRIRGAGLGLYICKSIVEAHGGRIGVEPVEGGGARFWLRLPRTSRATEALP